MATRPSKRQLGEWTVTIEGWEDAYVSWLHDARIKVRVMDDVDNALNSGASCWPLGRNPGHRPDRTRSQDLGEGR